MPLVAKGHDKGVDGTRVNLRVNVTLDAQTFAYVRKQALRRGETFAETVRQLMFIGIAADK